MNRRTLAAGIIAAALTTTGTLALQPWGAAASSTTTHRATTMRFVAHDVAGQMTTADLADPQDGQPGIGDEIAFTQRLTQGSQAVGRVSNVAFGVDAERHLFQANGTMVLDHGQITLAGLVSQQPHFTLAVTGGTGRYQGARGQVDFDFTDGNQVLTVTLR